MSGSWSDGRNVPTVGLLALLVGCSSGAKIEDGPLGTSDDEEETTDLLDETELTEAPEPQSEVVVQVDGAAGPLAQAVVKVGDQEQVTDIAGMARFKGLPAGQARVSVEHATMVPWTREVTVASNGGGYVVAQGVSPRKERRVVQAGVELVVDGGYFDLWLPPGSLVDGTGAVYTGRIDVEHASFLPADGLPMTLPGTSVLTDGSSFHGYPYVWLAVKSDAGLELFPSPTAPPKLVMDGLDGLHRAAVFDPGTLRWTEVAAESSGPAVTVGIDHFGWWVSFGQPTAQSCVSMRVEDPDGEPVRAWVDLHSGGRVDHLLVPEAGTCVPWATSYGLNGVAFHPELGEAWFSTTMKPGATCGGGCEEVVMTFPPLSCFEASVFDADGSTSEGRLWAPFGFWRSPGVVSGGFGCAVGHADAYYLEARAGERLAKGPALASGTAPAASCGGDCKASGPIEFEPERGCVTGTVMKYVPGPEDVPVKVPDANRPTFTLVDSWLEPTISCEPGLDSPEDWVVPHKFGQLDSDGRFCLEWVAPEVANGAWPNRERGGLERLYAWTCPEAKAHGLSGWPVELPNGGTCADPTTCLDVGEISWGNQ